MKTSLRATAPAFVALTAVIGTAAFAGGPVAAFLGPTAYTSTADSPFDLSAVGITAILEDFEDGVNNLPGVTMTAGAIKPPSATTDSVDADDGSINGVGTGGHSWIVPPNQILNVTFNAAVLGGLPTEVGFVLTSTGSNATITISVFGPTGLFEGFKNYIFAPAADGSVADDFFIGVTFPGGISAFAVTTVPNTMELDHFQFLLPVPATATFVGPTPYLSAANSPFDISGIGYSYVLEDYEDAVSNTPGMTANFAFIVPPLSVTDSVDGDDSVIDGFGTAGHSIYTGATPLTVINFDAVALGGLPTQFGIVATDCLLANRRITMSVYGTGGVFLGQRTYPPMFDTLSGGQTAEDRFIGVTVPSGISRIEMSPGAIEYDHLQYNLPNPTADPFLGPFPYFGLADSPFALGDTDLAFYVEDAEDALFDDIPGATASFTQFVAPSIFTDSVDGDDGVIDGNGNAGRSMLVLLPGKLEIQFDAAALDGYLPTAFGFVWTDGGVGVSNVTFEAFDGVGNNVGTKTFMSFGDGASQGGTAEDRFMGIEVPGGIGKIRVSSNRAFEFDHVQILVPIDPIIEGDLNDDGIVDGGDLGILLNNWGTDGVGDLNGDGLVDGADLGTLLNLWTL